ncbi:MAG: hypothetical protein ACLFU9_00020 [Candidatus Bathyarchaeia archaeon]
MAKQDFEKILFEAVDEALFSLGESSRQAIYFHLEKNFGIKKQEIASKTEVFKDAIEEIFGEGANFLEILIMKHLYKRIGGSFELQETADFAFLEYVNTARRIFCDKKTVKSILDENFEEKLFEKR